MEEKNAFYKLDTEKKYSVLGRAQRLGMFIFFMCFASVFLVGGVAALLFDITKGKVSEALIVGLMFLAFGTLFLIFIVKDGMQELKLRGIEKRLLKKGDLTRGSIYNYKCVEVRRSGKIGESDSYYYKVEFDYQYENRDGHKVSHKFNRRLDYRPYLSDYRKVIVCFDDKSSIILDDYSISESGENCSGEARPDIEAHSAAIFPPEDQMIKRRAAGVKKSEQYKGESRHDKLYRGLSGKNLKINPNRKYATKDYSQNYIWAGIACLGLFGAIFLVFFILLLANIDYTGSKSFVMTNAFPFLIACIVFLPVLTLGFCILGIGLSKKRREKRLLADCKFTYGNLVLPNDAYSRRVRYKLTYYFLTDKRERREGKVSDNVALRTITANRRVIVAYNEKDSMIFDMAAVQG